MKKQIIFVAFSLLFPLALFAAWPSGGSGSGTDDTKLPLTGGTMTGQLTVSGATVTVTGSQFSVGASTFVVTGGNVGIGTTTPTQGSSGGSTLDINGDFILTNGLMGLGTTAPTQTLDVNGSLAVTGAVPIFQVGTATFTVIGGQVGIGTTAPAYTLDVQGNISSTGTATVDGLSATTTLVLPQGDDPNVDATGEISFDTDGWIRVSSGSLQPAIRYQEELHVSVVTPNTLDDSERDALYFWQNVSGMSFVVTGWKALSDTDDTTLAIEECDEDGGNSATVDAVEIATNGTGLFYASDTTITAATVENGHRLRLDFDDTDAPGLVQITIYGYSDGDVN